MDNHTSFIFQLLGVSNLLEEHTNLETGLQEVTSTTAKILQVQRCSIMLLSESENRADEECYLRVFTHYGNLPKSAYQEVTRLNQGIAGYVAATGQPLLIKDISQSQFYKVARYYEDTNKSLMSAPIRLGEQIIGVINVSSPIARNSFDEQNLELLQLLALFVGKSTQIVQLQTILKSKFVEMAVACELGERYIEEPIAPLPNPNRLAKIVAKSFFRELTQAGFGPSQIIEIANEVLNLLQKNIDKYRKRLSRDD